MAAPLLLFIFLVSSSLLDLSASQDCSLSNEEKFNCSSLDGTTHPPIIYQDSPFTIDINRTNASLLISNASLFTSTNGYCGPHSFASGAQCSVLSTEGVSNSTITCSNGFHVGPAVLIIGLADCALPLYIQWGQLPTLSVQENGEDIDVVGNIYVVRDQATPFDVICSVSPPSELFSPVLNARRLDENSPIEGLTIYQKIDEITASFGEGFSLDFSGVYTCSSSFNASTSLFIVTAQDIPSVYYPNGNTVSSVTLGSPLNIKAAILTDRPVDTDSVQFMSLNSIPTTGSTPTTNVPTIDPSSSPMSPTGPSPVVQLIEDDEYDQSLYITFDAVGQGSAGLYNVCFSYFDANSSSLGSGSDTEAVTPEVICVGTFNISSISVPTVTSLNDTLVVKRSSSFTSGSVTLTCIPSDPSAIIRWQYFNGVPLWEQYSSYLFSPPGLNHTLTLTSPPYGILLIECGLYDPGLIRLVNGIEITIVSVSRPVSIWNNNNELFSDAIINSFRAYFPLNTPFLSLRCFAEEGHGQLQWSTRDVSSLPEALLTSETAPDLSVIGTGQDLTINYANFDANDTGYYVCSSGASGENFEVYTTLSNPYFNVTTPSFIRAPIGTNVSLVMRYAYGSEGFSNNGQSFLLSLHIQPSNPIYSSFYAVNNTTLPNLSYRFNYTFIVGVIHTGILTFEVTQNNATVYNRSGQFLAITPVFSPLPASTVYAIIGRRVNISCSPNETAAPVYWTIEFTNYEILSSLLDVPEFDLSPPGLNHMLEFNLTSTTFSSAFDVDLPSISQMRFTCGFRNGTNFGIYNPRTIRVDIEQERIFIAYFRSNVANDSIVNYFPQFYDSKRSVAGGSFASFSCTGVQGDHYPVFKVELFNETGLIRTVNASSPNNEIAASPNGEFQNTLYVYVHRETSGRYYCESSVSGAFKSFIVTSENPFIRAASSKVVNAFLGESITLSFLAAYYSQGDGNYLRAIPVMFTSNNGTVINYYSYQSCEDDPCYYYSLSLRSVTPRSAGQYTAYLDDDYEYEYDYSAEAPNDTITVNVEVPQLLTGGLVVQALLDTQIPLSCKPSKGSFLISWQHNGQPLNCETEGGISTCQFTNNQQDTLLLNRISYNDAGTYTCTLVLNGEPIISENITLGIIQYCPTNFSNGILWGVTPSGSVARVPCTAAGPQFQSGLFATRVCSDVSRWEVPDMTTCLLKEESNNVASVWVTVNTSNATSTPNDSALVEVLQRLLVNYNVSYKSVSLATYTETGSVLLEFSVELTEFNDNTTATQLNQLVTSSTQFGGLYVLPQRSGVQLFISASSCPCLPEDTNTNTSSVTYLCYEGATTPCNCDTGVCQCVPPFVGDGRLCTVDSDGDSFPDEPLTSCAPNSTLHYCIQDNCRRTFNPNQDLAACQILENFEGCGFGIDTEWGIAWANVLVGEVDRQPCPGDAATLGTATKACLSVGVWGETNVLDCLPVEYQNYLDQVESILDANITIDEQLSLLSDLVSTLATSTSEVVESAELFLPGSLNATNKIVDTVIDVLFDTLDEENDNISRIVDGLDLVQVFDNLLDSNQLAAWQQLQQSPQDTTLRGSTELLSNVERYGKYLALSRNETTLRRRSNIVINANQYSATSESLVFPQPGDTDGTLFTSERGAEVSIPPELLRERKNRGDTTVPVVSILFKNLENFLEADGTSFNNTRPGSIVWSGQVAGMTRNTEFPISLRFNVDNFTNSSGYKCVYWNTTRREWSIDGVNTVSSVVNSTTGRATVYCQSFHLTAFAVLVDVSGTITETGSTEYTALRVVSYIGCAISIACLIVTVIFFLIQGKALLRSVHFLIHLNLALALLCGYFIFAVGVETARNSSGGCAFVAALLQYFFLSSFCWMLCEGVMLYLMLVKVFSTLSKRWYFFLILGWAPPLLPVVIGLAAGHSNYGVKNDEGDLLYCWLSVDNGVIWAFVAPMIVIIIINSVFLALALYAIWKTRSNQQSIKKKTGANRDLALSLLKASLVLLPLLGLTWLFGLLAVNRNTSAFAWIFTLLNTLQGAAIFFFHVVRSDKVWSKLSPRINKVKRGLTSKTRTYNYISTSSTMKASKDSQSSISMGTIKKSVVENDYSTATSLGFANVSVEDGDDEKIELAELEEKKMPTEEKVEEMSLNERAKEKEKEALGSD